MRAMVDTMLHWVKASADEPTEIYKVGQNTTRLLMSVGDLLVGWLLQRQAEIALRALDDNPSARDTAFYQGKVGAAGFFANTVLPELSARRKVVEHTDNALMDLDEAAF